MEINGMQLTDGKFGHLQERQSQMHSQQRYLSVQRRILWDAR